MADATPDSAPAHPSTEEPQGKYLEQEQAAQSIELAKGLLSKATPRSRSVIERIASLDAQQRLTDDDLKLLEQIVDRFSAN